MLWIAEIWLKSRFQALYSVHCALLIINSLWLIKSVNCPPARLKSIGLNRLTVYGDLGVLVDLVQVDRFVELLLRRDRARVILVIDELDGERPVALELADLSNFVLQFGEGDVGSYVGDHHLSFRGSEREEPC